MKKGQPAGKHGLCTHPLYNAWCNIKRRIFNPKTYAYHRYGGRGITIDEKWLNDFPAFYNWSIEHGWEKGLQIDRIDNNGNYTPNNCRFVTSKENACNREHTIRIEHNGISLMISDWSEKTGLSIDTIYGRFKKGLNSTEILSIYKLENSHYLKPFKNTKLCKTKK